MGSQSAEKFILDYPILDEELCWDEPKLQSTDEFQPSLLTEIGSRSGIRFLQLAVFWKDEAEVSAHLSLPSTMKRAKPAASSRSRISPANRSDCGHGSTQSGADLDEAICIFINAFPLQQLEALNEERINEMLAAKVA